MESFGFLLTAELAFVVGLPVDAAIPVRPPDAVYAFAVSGAGDDRHSWILSRSRGLVLHRDHDCCLPRVVRVRDSRAVIVRWCGVRVGDHFHIGTADKDAPTDAGVLDSAFACPSLDGAWRDVQHCGGFFRGKQFHIRPPCRTNVTS